jgi:hypothetical protein
VQLSPGGRRGDVAGQVTFSSRHDINRQALAEMITAIDAGLAAGQLTAR